MAYEHLKALIFGRPLLIAAGKLDAIMGGIGIRLGMPSPIVTGPMAEPKARGVYSVGGGIATIQAVGTLMDRLPVGLDDHEDGAQDAKNSGLAGYRAISDQLDSALSDPRVEGILLEVDSYGGEAFGNFDLADKIFAARAAKPIFGVASQKAMSAGYALLSQCERVFVPQAGEVGSVGVLCTHVDTTQADAKEGIRVTHVHAGARKVELSPHVPLSAEAKARLEAEVGKVYETFVSAVARGRGSRLTAEAVRATEAGTYIGEEAVKAGLADEVGDVSAARTALRGRIQEKRMLEQMTKERDAALLRVAAAEKRVLELEAAAKSREMADDAAYIEKLKADSAAAQAPIDAADIARVEAHMKAGRGDVARELGGFMLRAAKNAGGEKFKAPGGLVPPQPSPANDLDAMAARGAKKLLEAQGYTVTLSADGREVASATRK